MTTPTEGEPKAKPKSKGTARHIPPPKPTRGPRTRAQDAARLDESDPHVRRRIELVLEGVGLGWSKWTILRALTTGFEDVAAVTYGQANLYYTRGEQELEGALLEDKAKTVGKAIQRLEAVYKAAMKAGKHDSAMAAADRLALVKATPNPVTAARTIHVPEGPAPVTPLGGMSTPELRALVAKLAAEQTGKV